MEKRTKLSILIFMLIISISIIIVININHENCKNPNFKGTYVTNKLINNQQTKIIINNSDIDSDYSYVYFCNNRLEREGKCIVYKNILELLDYKHNHFKYITFEKEKYYLSYNEFDNVVLEKIKSNTPSSTKKVIKVKTSKQP